MRCLPRGISAKAGEIAYQVDAGAAEMAALPSLPGLLSYNLCTAEQSMHTSADSASAELSLRSARAHLSRVKVFSVSYLISAAPLAGSDFCSCSKLSSLAR